MIYNNFFDSDGKLKEGYSINIVDGYGYKHRLISYANNTKTTQKDAFDRLFKNYLSGYIVEYSQNYIIVQVFGLQSLTRVKDGLPHSVKTDIIDLLLKNKIKLFTYFPYKTYNKKFNMPGVRGMIDLFSKIGNKNLENRFMQMTKDLIIDWFADCIIELGSEEK